MLIVVFDIDGTLANNSHRQHFLADPKNRDWDSFNKNMEKDTLHEDIAFLMRILHLFRATNLIATGREECYRDVTVKWLAEMGLDNFYHKLYMRPTKDYRDDQYIKYDILNQIREEYEEPYLVFDDRQKVVDMWRANKIRCLQVQPGNF